jgi:hypothetical protein
MQINGGMRKVLFILFIVLTSNSVWAQKQQIKGVLKDSTKNTMISGALITVIRTADSILVDFSYSDSSGTYSFGDLAADDYRLIISYPGFVDYVEDASLKESQFRDLGIQFLTSKYKLLTEVVIRQKKAAMELKKDTLEFLADSFQVRSNASIEDLLKALPGIFVNREGKITVHGQRVNQVLVDGEEFFGNDPTIVTQNLPAKIVDKVQVFDKKSEFAAATGIDDGKSTKIINVKLKENSKKGYFGKLVLGGSLDNYWNNNLMINAFKNKRQLSVFAMHSNTGRTLLDRNDQSKYGFKVNDKIGTGIAGLGDLYADVGIPKSNGAGVHYANKWNADKNGFNTNLTGGQINNIGIQTVSTQIVLKDSILLMSERYLIDNQRTEYSWDGKYDLQLDSTSSISTVLRARHGNLSANNAVSSQTENATGLINATQQTVNLNSTYNNYNTEVSWKKRINTKGRSISAIVRYDYLSNHASGLLKTLSEFYLNGGSTQKRDTLNYRRNNSSEDYSIVSKITYREPIWESAFLDINYGSTTSNYAAQWNTSDIKNNHTNPIDSLSSNYRYLIASQTGGFVLSIPKNKFTFSLGTNLSNTTYSQKNRFTKKSDRFSFFNILPNTSIGYSFSKLTNLRLSYTGITTPPSIQQINPVVDNTNPIVNYKGNLGLRQEFSSSYSLLFNSLKPIVKRTLYSLFSYTRVKNAISTNDYIDQLGKRVIQPINTPYATRLFSYINYTFELKKLKLNWTNDITLISNNGTNLINGVVNRTNNSTYTFTTSFSKSNKKISTQLNCSFGYNIINYSFSLYKDIKFWSSNNSASMTGVLPGRFEIGSDCQLLLQQQSKYFNNPTSLLQWNIQLSKKVFKADNGLFKLSINNLLDQNTGYSRTASSTFVSERLTETIGRYWLLSFVLNFNNQIKK